MLNMISSEEYHKLRKRKVHQDNLDVIEKVEKAETKIH